MYWQDNVVKSSGEYINIIRVNDSRQFKDSVFPLPPSVQMEISLERLTEMMHFLNKIARANKKKDSILDFTKVVIVWDEEVCGSCPDDEDWIGLSVSCLNLMGTDEPWTKEEALEVYVEWSKEIGKWFKKLSKFINK